MKAISHISQNFRRDVRFDNSLYIGDVNRVSAKKRFAPGQSERISIRFKSDMYERLSVLAYALDCSVARATCLLLDATVREVDFINNFVRGYLSKHMDEKRMEDVKVSAEKVQDTVSEFVINHWRK